MPFFLYLKKFRVTDEPVTVHVIDVEEELELLVPVDILCGEHGEAPHELREVQLAAVVGVKHLATKVQ